jgi:hypothetical protein
VGGGRLQKAVPEKRIYWLLQHINSCKNFIEVCRGSKYCVWMAIYSIQYIYRSPPSCLPMYGGGGSPEESGEGMRLPETAVGPVLGTSKLATIFMINLGIFQHKSRNVEAEKFEILRGINK